MSNNMISYNYLRGLNQANYKQVDAMQRMYSQHGRLLRPSDNPVDTVLDMRHKISLTLNEQYTANNDAAISWMDLTHDSMDGVTNILHRVKELVIEAAKPSPQIAHDAIAEEITALTRQIMEIGNTTLGDRHIFAGQNDRAQAPYYLAEAGQTLPDGTTAAVDTVVYTGDDHKVSIVIDPGSTNPAYDSVNLTGNQVFNNGELFEDLIELRDMLVTGEDAVGTLADYLSGTALENLDKNTDALLASQSFLSAKMSMHHLKTDLLEKSNVQITGNISQMEDMNIADASIAFTIAQTTFNAALSMGSRILPMSLVDFLR
jgi:flagellar hook-associated protein 3 FlgL